MEKPSAREGMNVADGCSLFRNEHRQTTFTDLTFLTAPLLRVANGQCRELRDRMVLCISLLSSFLHMEEGRDGQGYSWYNCSGKG